MKAYPLQLTSRKGTVEIKYIQRSSGYVQCKATDGFLYPLASFTCNSNFIKFCEQFDIWDSGRDNSV
jgi:hypothetical protein